MDNRYFNDTIAAISTAPGNAGIGIVRISGPEAFSVAENHFRPAGFNGEFNNIPDRHAAYGHIIYRDGGGKSGKKIDEAILIKMKGPWSYTAEDTVEFQCHGGQTVLAALLESLLRSGARPAEPGEFTKRAFLNGRIDLAQAEAVMDIINARTKEAAQNAFRHLDGEYSEKIKSIREPLIMLLARIEAAFDYPEHDMETALKEDGLKQIAETVNSVKSLIAGYDTGKLYREGASVVLAGEPNVGKSSIMNRLSGKYRAIVTDIPGTTRDIIEEYLDLGGIPVRLVDTAGLRQTDDRVERIGVDLAEREIKQADLVIYVVEATGEFDPATLNEIQPDRLLIAVNKADLGNEEDDEALVERVLKCSRPEKLSVAVVSAVTGRGMNRLTEIIIQKLRKKDVPGYEQEENIFMSNMRHKKLLEQAMEALDRAASAIRSGITLDCVAADIHEAVDSIGMITGDVVDDMIENAIFSRFCIGK